MSGVLPNVGEAAMLDNSLKNTTPEALILKLYSNNYDCINTSIASNFTEVSDGGYASKALTRAGWNSAVGGSPSYSQYSAAQVFSFTGAVAGVVGYFLVGASSGTLYGAERLYAGTGQAFANGDSLSVTPKITFGSVTND
jgi:hypothetical protein